MNLCLAYNFWRSIIAAHQYLQCSQIRPFPPCCMVALLGAVARMTVNGN
jgi:hypothetical protein